MKGGLLTMVISHWQVLTGMILQAFQLQSMLVSGYIVHIFFPWWVLSFPQKWHRAWFRGMLRNHHPKNHENSWTQTWTATTFIWVHWNFSGRFGQGYVGGPTSQHFRMEASENMMNIHQEVVVGTYLGCPCSGQVKNYTAKIFRIL